MAVPVSPSPLDTAEYREQLAETYGFKQIGEPLPNNVTLRDVIESLPKEVLILDYKRQAIVSTELYIAFCKNYLFEFNSVRIGPIIGLFISNTVYFYSSTL